MESQRQDRYYLPQIPSREEAQEEKGQEIGPATVLFLALVGALFAACGALTCYLIYGLRH